MNFYEENTKTYKRGWIVLIPQAMILITQKWFNPNIHMPY